MILWMNQVTDRSQNDVERAIELLSKNWDEFTSDEKTEYLQGLKGCLNETDLKRIQNNISLLSDVLELGLAVSSVPEIPMSDFYNEIISNVGTIRNSYMVHGSTPQTPTAPLTAYQKWNDIEQILYDVYEILLNNFNYYCGNEIYAGDETGLLL